MRRLRFGIRFKLLLLSLFLFSIPWLGYQYVWELESYLRLGQEQTMVGTARAVASALHERPTLFDSQAAYLSAVQPGKDLYAHKIIDPIQLDGDLRDWRDYRSLALYYGQDYLISQEADYNPASLSFEHMVGQHNDYLYAMFAVTDDHLIWRPTNSLRVDRNDHLRIAMKTPDGNFKRYIVAPKSSGWVNAYLLEDDPNSLRAARLETQIQGYWKQTPTGYNVELRFPLDMMANQIAFAIVDVDDGNAERPQFVIGTADTGNSDQLGTVLVPAPEIENIIRGLKYSNARVWVVDKHKRVLARSGDIRKATGITAGTSVNDDTERGLWHYIEQHWLLPLYYQILTRPPADFIDELKNAYELKGQDISDALLGNPASQWRLSPDNKAVILSAAHPIFIDGDVRGAVVVEQTTNGIRTLRNRALEKLFHVILAVMTLGTLALFLFASRISTRIRRLRDNTEAAIDKQGKIVSNLQPSRTQDEIGDLSRTFYSVLERLRQYHHYLENMAARLSHELRTPVAIVNSSLENLLMESPEQQHNPYVQRAQEGIQRLSRILTNMSEASRLEQALQASERQTFDLNELVKGCVQGYQLVYPNNQFTQAVTETPCRLFGAPELLAQMLDKIIANACEFSQPEHAICIGTQRTGQQVVLWIRNKGPLLDPQMADRLFDSMVSIRKQQGNSEAHLGLGLFIAKMIAEYHGGNIFIQNQADQSGVEVIIRLPVTH